jgi:uncharacterized pyridoxal phosphate-containing UPF0001 family protein
MKRVSIFMLALLLSSCSALSVLDAIPNPLEDGKGINTNVAIGKNVEASNTKSLIALDRVDIGQSNLDSNQKANEITNNVTNINWLMIGALVLLAGMAIPTRSQAKANKLLQENLDYERARTNITVEAAANTTKAVQERQEARQA